MEGKSFYMIEIAFDQERGGEDFEAIFLLLDNASDFTIELMPYAYEENDGIGYRLRKAYNSKRISGILFSDYINNSCRRWIKMNYSSFLSMSSLEFNSIGG